MDITTSRLFPHCQDRGLHTRSVKNAQLTGKTFNFSICFSQTTQFPWTETEVPTHDREICTVGVHRHICAVIKAIVLYWAYIPNAII